jgi:DNA helicase-2/ATP-dependent DNA helicase PcrA
LHAANVYLNQTTNSHLKSLFLALKTNPETSAYRRDLFHRFINVLTIHIDGGGGTLSDAANLYQKEMRHTGRSLSHRKLIGTTLLVIAKPSSGGTMGFDVPHVNSDINLVPSKLNYFMS